MELEKKSIKNKFDDIDEKIDFLIELCQELQAENRNLIAKNKQLKKELTEMNNSEIRMVEQENQIRSNMDRLMKKLDEFSSSQSGT